MGVIKKYVLAYVLLLSAITANCQKVQKVDGHDCVDLGLSVNWASCNIGSRSPEEYGDYFAWGETYTKASYSRLTYKYAGGKEGIDRLMDYVKYKGDENKQNPNDSKLELCDDVAHVLWGGGWRMPTMAEIKELVDSCDWVFDEYNDIMGCWAISKINGNRIFFPLAGYIYDDVVSDVGLSGKYWASELRADMCFEAYQIWIAYDDDLARMENKSSVILSDDGYRQNGRTVRPVCDK